MTSTGRRWWISGLVVVALVAGLLSRFASEEPDGLERVATDQGILERAVEREPVLAYDSLGRLIGVAVVLVVALALTWVLRRRAAGARGR